MLVDREKKKYRAAYCISSRVNNEMKKVRCHDIHILSEKKYAANHSLFESFQCLIKILCHRQNNRQWKCIFIKCHYLFINDHAKKAFIICLYHTLLDFFLHCPPFSCHPLLDYCTAVFWIFYIENCIEHAH